MYGIIHNLLYLYLIIVFARIILSWFPMSAGSPLAPVNRFLYAVTEPVMGPIRRALPPIRAGAMAFDLSPIIVLFGIEILQRLIPA